MTENDWRTILHCLAWTAGDLAQMDDDKDGRNDCLEDIRKAHENVLEESGLPPEASPMRVIELKPGSMH